MIIAHFLKWIETAKAHERALAASALARAYVQRELPFEDRCAAEAALTLLLDDPAARVRKAMADALALSPHAPPQVISALASDQPEVAAIVVARSPLLSDADLIDRVATGTPAAQSLIATRAVVSMELAAAIAEVADDDACRALLANHGAEIAPLTFRRLTERFGQNNALRETMIAHPRLPADCRHMLLVNLGQALRGAPLVVASMGTARAERLFREACVKASVTLLERTAASEYPALVAHLRLRGDLTTSFIIRAIAHGKVDFLGSVLVALSGLAEHRVQSLLASGGDTALEAAFRKADLPEKAHAPLIRALRVWREVANGRRRAGAQEVSWAMLEEVGGTNASGDIATLLKSIHLEALRENARDHALAIAAA